ncbi:GON-4-like protein isoform X3 [Apus apus]|uniref:GON-4-like protein isoform X3 n=1 Tax=Apus apus TaxID=8895 RepID=UPI0021F90EF8|nr:GON-4-like protein isoform X3 [Apus apus]
MSLSLKMLPCKKRRAAVAGPQSPRERGGAGEDGELPGTGGSTSAADGGSCARPAPAARAGASPSGPGVWRGPGESALKGGKRPPARAAPGPAEEAPAAKEACAAAPLPEGCPEAPGEGKMPQLCTEVEGNSQRDAHLAETQPAVQESPGRSSSQLAGRNPPVMKLVKNTRAEEQGGEDTERRKRRRKATKRKREGKSQEEEGSLSCGIKLDDTLDRTLEDGAKQHNLTVVNVRNILHEVITNEHVVAMMKAAISETEDIPLFEPKMTRSKLKEVVEKGVVIPTWNISPIKKANEVKPPQFVDIPLEEDDSSDEEYQPEDEDEDETAEESLLESDVESTASSPRGAKRSRTRRSSDEEGGTLCEMEGAATHVGRHISAEVVPMGPPPPPKPKQTRDSTFMEKLHAVDEELASSPVCMDSYQALEDSLIAFRTRSKRPLKDVPLGQLEAELRAPDITPDMYDPNTADDEEWKRWLGGLMNDDVENEDEADDDDDPEYNFLEDLDEPDTEDFRNDRAVRITKKEVNELMEELFETFQDEMGFSNMEDEGPEDEDNVTESRPNFNTPQALRFEEPLANLLNEQHRAVKEQLEQLRMKKSSIKPQQETEKSKPQNEKPLQTLVLDSVQRKRLQQQMQQHVQLLTQIHLLASSNPALSSEASTTRMFLSELGNFARSSTLLRQSFNPKFQTMFQPCNLKGALKLIEDFHAQVQVDWSPRKAAKKSANEFPCLPKQVAWILATRRVFMYPELLPICSLKANPPRDKIIFTKAEDNLLALGLKHFEGTEFPKPLISKYLLPTKTAHQLTVRIKNLNMNRAPDNIIKYYKKTKQLPVLFKCCEEIQPDEWKPPVEREEHRLPFWLKASLPSIQEELKQLAEDTREMPASPDAESVFLATGKETSDADYDEKYPLLIPKGLVLTLKPLANQYCRRAWRRQRSSALKPVLIQLSPCLQPSSNTINIQKTVKLAQSEAPPSKVKVPIPRLIQPAAAVQTVPGVQPLNVPAVVGSGDGLEFPSVLPTSQSDSRQAFSAAVPSALVSSNAVTFQPASAGAKPRKPCVRKGSQRKKGTKSALLLKAPPLIQPSPVILTVPATTVKVVNIGNGCNMIQPINTTVGRGAQAIPVTTLLVNPSTFPCPLNQPLVTSSIPSLIVSPNPVGLSAPSVSENEEQLNLVPSCTAGNNQTAHPTVEPKAEPPELYISCSAVSPKKDCATNPATSNNGSQEKVKKSDCCSWTVVEGDKNPPEPLAVDLLPHLEGPDEMMKTEHEDSNDAVKEVNPVQKRDLLCAEVKEEFVLDLGQELNMEAACSCSDDLKDIKKEHTLCGGKGEEQQRALQSSAHGEQQMDAGGVAGPQVRSESPKNLSYAADVETEFSSPLGRPEDSSSIDGQSVGTPAGPEAGGEREGQEEEEEDDFDDFTQDEDEEMSSASEESILSVPELQETMEKLTWLATERHLSQEGDSEEENSQEENSEPEEEEEEEGEGIESLKKDDEICGDVSEEPKSVFTLTKTAPQVEAHRTPAGENMKAPGKSRSSHRTRNKRGRARASKDTSKLLLLYDEDILERDPLREQKDLAFAQAYLSRFDGFEEVSLPDVEEEDEPPKIHSTSKNKKRKEMGGQNNEKEVEWVDGLKECSCSCHEGSSDLKLKKSKRRTCSHCSSKVCENKFYKNRDSQELTASLVQQESSPQPEGKDTGISKEPAEESLENRDEGEDAQSKAKVLSRKVDSLASGSQLEGRIVSGRHTTSDKAGLPDDQGEDAGVGAVRSTAKDSDSASIGPRWTHLQKATLKLPQETKDCPCSGESECEVPNQPHQGNADASLGLSRDLLLSSCSAAVKVSTGSSSSSGKSFCQTEGLHSDSSDKLTVFGHTSKSGVKRSEGPLVSLEGKPEAKQGWSTMSRKATLGKSCRSQSPNNCVLETDATGCTGNFPERIKSNANNCFQVHQHSEQLEHRGVPPSLGQKEEEQQQQRVTEATVCAKNSKVSSTGEKVVLWTREADRVILTTCQEKGAHLETFQAISQKLGNKTASEVSHRFRELMRLFHTSCDGSSEDEEDATSTSNTDQLSDKDLLLSEEEPDD